MLLTEDVDRIVNAMMEAPRGIGMGLMLPNGTQFRALLPALPRPGDVVWHPHPRVNSPLRRFVVERLEFVHQLYADVEVYLREMPSETRVNRDAQRATGRRRPARARSRRRSRASSDSSAPETPET